MPLRRPHRPQRTRRAVLLDIETRLQWAKSGQSVAPARDPALVADAVRHFGTIAAAIAAYRRDTALVRGKKRVFTDPSVTRERLRSVRRLGLSLQPKVLNRADASLGIYARRHHTGSYPLALEAIGVDPDDVLTYRYRDAGDWLAITRARAEAGQSLRRRDVAVENPRIVDAIERLVQRRGRPVTRLVGGRRQRLRGWRAGLHLAGLDPDVYDPDDRWWKPRVVREIRARREQGQSLRAKAVEREDPTLYSMAKHHYGKSWPAAVRAAGYDPTEERRRDLAAKHAVEEQAVIDAVQARLRANLPVDHASVEREAPAIARAGCRLFGRAGRWDGVLRAAGADPQTVRAATIARSADTRRVWTDEALAELILDRLLAGDRLTPTALIKDGYGAAANKLFAMDGGFIGFCANLGIHLEDLGERVRRKWAGDPEAVIRAIRRCRDDGHDLSASSVWQLDPSLHAAASLAFKGVSMTPFGLHAGWDRALAVAGIDPSTTRRDIDEDSGRGVRFDNLCQALFAILRPGWEIKPPIDVGSRHPRKRLYPDARDPQDNTWIDFKLRGTGLSVVKSVRKYQNHATRMHIITLLGETYPIAGVTYASVFDFEREATTPETRELFAALHLLARTTNPEAEPSLNDWARRWTTQRVIEGIRALSEPDLQSDRARQQHRRLYWGATQRFTGGWYAAVAAAGRDASGVRKRAPASTPAEREAFVARLLADGQSLRCTDVSRTAQGRRVYKAACRYEPDGWSGLVRRTRRRSRRGT